MINKDLLARIPASAAPIREAVAAAFEIAERLAIVKAGIDRRDTLSDRGKAEAIREALPVAAKDLAEARKPIDKLARDIKTRRMAMRVPDVEPANLAGAITAMELRQFLRGLDAGQRTALLTGTRDQRILEAALSAPPELSGLTGPAAEEIAQLAEARYAAITHGQELAEIEAAEQIVAEATALAQLARDEIQRASGMSVADFSSVFGPAERDGWAPWLIRSGDRVLVCEIEADGSANYRPATDYDQRAGKFYESFDEYRAARGETDAAAA